MSPLMARFSQRARLGASLVAVSCKGRRYEIADSRTGWVLDRDRLPLCLSCLEPLTFYFSAAVSTEPTGIRCSHHCSHLLPSL